MARRRHLAALRRGRICLGISRPPRRPARLRAIGIPASGRPAPHASGPLLATSYGRRGAGGGRCRELASAGLPVTRRRGRRARNSARTMEELSSDMVVSLGMQVSHMRPSYPVLRASSSAMSYQLLQRGGMLDPGALSRVAVGGTERQTSRRCIDGVRLPAMETAKRMYRPVRFEWAISLSLRQARQPTKRISMENHEEDVDRRRSIEGQKQP